MKADSIVISGISGCFPNSRNVAEFSQNLYGKVDMVTIDDRRWTPVYTKMSEFSGKLYDLEKFDGSFFGVHYRQIDATDPMGRHFLEKSIEAIMDAGVNPSDLEGTRTGVYVGICNSEYSTYLRNKLEPECYGGIGLVKSIIANRLSYHLKLQGPSHTGDTACSSSLFALDRAYRDMKNGLCDKAIVGGCNVLQNPETSAQFHHLGVLSPTGRCRPFDDRADGYVRGECIAVAFLQKTEDAKRVYCEVLHSKTNCDGYKEQGITFPSSDAQINLMREVLEEAGVKPADVSYLECHGTGTLVGDPEEVNGITSVYMDGRNRRLLIGSSKSNIGHTEPASGLAAVVKTILAMENGLVPPNMNYEIPRREIDGLRNGSLKVVVDPTPFDDDNGLIGINNFGFGGGNAHVLLEWNHKTKVNGRISEDELPRLVCVSGRTEEAVTTILDDITAKRSDPEYLSLLHEIFKRDIRGHLFRGFSIVQKSGEVTRSVKFVGKKTTFKYLAITDFGNDWMEIQNDLNQLGLMKASIKKMNDLSAKLGLGLEQEDSRMAGIRSAMLQLALVDTLNCLKLKFDGVLAYGSFSKIVRDYYNKSISLEQCLKSLIDTKMNHVNGHDDPGKISWDLKQIAILELGKNQLNLQNENVIVLPCQNLLTLLQSLGRLYELGQNLAVSQLYPKIEYPVSRGTPMISHLIKWDHSENWEVANYETYDKKFSKGLTLSVHVDIDSDSYNYINGHLIDGRVLFPATGYLFLVWEVFAHDNRKRIGRCGVVFENCRFVRAMTLNKEKSTAVDVAIQKGSGNFEITQDNITLVTGRIRFPTTSKELEFLPIPDGNKDDDNEIKLQVKDFYKELRLRGYNYNGIFKSVVECNTNVTRAKIAWYENWVAFLDNMLQIKILHMDTRSLYVPTEIKQLIINPEKHLKQVASLAERTEVPVFVSRTCDVIRTEGIQISGLGATSISRRKPAEPLLEKYKFVPNSASLTLRESVKVNAQIVLENLQISIVKIVELIDDASDLQTKVLSPMLHDVFTNLPLIQSTCTVLSQRLDLVIENVTISHTSLASESDCAIVVVSDGLQRPAILSQALKTLKPSGFIISREKLDTIWPDNQIVDIITVHTTDRERLVLVRARAISDTLKVVHVTNNDDFSWIPELQSLIEINQSILVVSQDPESGIVGLVNCLRQEHASDKIKCVFTPDKAPIFDLNNDFYSYQLSKRLAFNVFKANEWGTYRHLDADELTETDSEHCFLTTTERGNLSSLKWIEGPLKVTDGPERNQEQVYVYYSSINFRDIMSASGRINTDFLVKNRLLHDFIQGIEVSGRTSSGKRVMGSVIGGGLATLVLSDVSFLNEVPDNWTLEDAATVPTVYTTVIYALLVLTRIQRGDKILIHSGSGGVGQAAINIALHYGCEVFTTVGTQEKRDFLLKQFPQLTDDHIGNSRDTSFETMVMVQTDSRGVDFVLNSLIEEKLDASVRCLGRGGRFLEIGKFDISNNKLLQLVFLEKNASFHGIMLDNVINGNNIQMKNDLMRVLEDNIKIGAVKPIVRTVFGEHQAEEAFRYMTTGKHIGKVLIKMRSEEANIIVIPSVKVKKALPKYWCHSDEVYVIVGGSGGFGMELADWLIVRGARKIVLTSRRGVSTGYQIHRINLWKSYGVQVVISTEDVTSQSGCEAMLKRALSLGPIDGIFNLAVVLRDALFENQTDETFTESMKPKAHVTKHLDKLSRRYCPNLRSFVIFSSVSCGRGNAGQTNYGMANSIMERICEKRRSEGLPGLGIQWGAIGDVGLVVEMQEQDIDLEIGGTLQQRIFNCLELMDRLLNQKCAVVSSIVVSENRRTITAGASIIDVVADIIGIKDSKTVSHHMPLPELGMDSMNAVELKQILERDYDIVLTPQDLRTITLSKLQEYQESTNNEESMVKDSVELENELIYDETLASLPHIDFKTKALASQQTRILFIPGIEGMGKCFEALATKLTVQASCLHYPLCDVPITIKNLAKLLLPSVKQLCGSGEFKIVGYSFGGAVAIELVSMLEQEGYNGRLLCLDGSPLFFKSSFKKLMESNSDVKLLASIINLMANVYVNKIIAVNDQIKLFECKTTDEVFNIAVPLLAAMSSHYSEAYIKRCCQSSYSRLKGSQTYEPIARKIKSTVSLFKASTSVDAALPEDYGLGEICENLLRVERFEGDHLSMLNTVQLAEALDSFFKE